MNAIDSEMKKNNTPFYLLAAFFLCAFSSLLAQERQDNAWKAFFTDFSLSNSSTLRIETHLRTKDFMAENDQYLFRPGFSYKINRFASLTAGFTLLSTNKGENRLKEQNLWQQFSFRLPLKRSQYFGWIRLEQRWQKLGDIALDYGARIRFRTGFEFPLAVKEKKEVPKFVVFNEVFLITNKNFPYHYNQNWTFIGFKQKIFSKGVLLSGFQRNTIDKGNGNYLHKNIWSSILFFRP